MRRCKAGARTERAATRSSRTGKERLRAFYDRLLKVSTDGQPVVLRPHVGEGANDMRFDNAYAAIKNQAKQRLDAANAKKNPPPTLDSSSP